MKRSLGFIALLFFIMTIVVACNSSEETNSNPDTPAVNTNESNEGVSVKDTLEFPLEEPVSLNFYSLRRDETRKDFSELSMYQELQTQTNVTIDWELVTAVQRAEQFNLMLAAGDLPDAFVGVNVLDMDQYTRLIEDRLLIPLDDLIEKYAPNIKAFYDKNPELLASFRAEDGQLYSIPGGVIDKLNKYNEIIFINEAWLKKINRSMPSTTEEFYEVLKAFSEQDMNGNGQNDEIPFSFAYGSRIPSMISGAFGTMSSMWSPSNWYAKDGRLHYAPIDEEYREYVSYLNRLANEGLLDREVFTHNAQAYRGKIRQQPEMIGAWIDQSAGITLGTLDSNYVPMPALSGPQGKKGMNHSGPTLRPTGMAITVKNPYPEITLKWLDSIYADEALQISLHRGPQGRNWEYTKDGLIEYFPPPEGMPNGEWRHNEAPGVYSPVMIAPDTVKQKIYAGPQAVRIELQPMFDADALDNYVPVLLMSSADSDRFNRLMTDINEYVGERFANWIFTGGLNDEWADYLVQLDKMGMQDALKIYNKYYEAFLKAQK